MRPRECGETATDLSKDGSAILGQHSQVTGVPVFCTQGHVNSADGGGSESNSKTHLIFEIDVLDFIIGRRTWV